MEKVKKDEQIRAQLQSDRQMAELKEKEKELANKRAENLREEHIKQLELAQAKAQEMIFQIKEGKIDAGMLAQILGGKELEAQHILNKSNIDAQDLAQQTSKAAEPELPAFVPDIEPSISMMQKEKEEKFSTPKTV